ncbi:GNAT family N-acetyltransferase [Maribacter sp. HTCC2170]|uniref:GNAT family N-acetyltransferase n=1 Tax=Maribacter sp. (strain HTCC2170 / KCCM 42371) TaxID=313603 RepID=UPI00006B214B|nr:GNAT family N-acetyltransferase [Maribacter sp. HTCC2170]EAR00055.1 Protein containing acetyltransferase (GNAT family) domain [Maribacter sp. HTCC2170]
MNEANTLISLNIDNLTSLWKTVSMPYHSYFSESRFDYCFMKDFDWPNRLWFHKDLSQEIISSTKEKIISISATLTIPYWDIYGHKILKSLESEGYVNQFEQVGMSLKLDKPLKVEDNLNIQLVTKKSDAILWSQLFKSSFGYKIHPEILIKSLKKIDYYIAYSQEHVVGTAIAYNTNKVMGVHSVGIPPAMRRKGYAEQIMKLLINSAVKNGSQYMTLQASDMGKHLYLKLGFQEDFVIKNYKLS